MHSYIILEVCVCVYVCVLGLLSVHKYSLPYKSLMHDVIWPACNPMTRGDSPHKLNILVIEWFTIYLQSVRFAFLDADANPLHLKQENAIELVCITFHTHTNYI